MIKEIVKLDKQIIIYGAGEIGKKVKEELLLIHGKVKYFVDKDEKKWNSHSVFSPERLLKEQLDAIVVIVSLVKSEPILSYFNQFKLQEDYNLFFYEPNMNEVFNNIYKDNLWGDNDSVSGSGSNLSQTKKIIEEIPKILEKYDIKSLLDAPCGDFYWMKEIEMNIKYIGMDIVSGVIKENQKYKKTNRTFLVGDLTDDTLPKVDLILCRDCLVHLSFEKINLALQNFKKSGSKYLLTTSFIERDVNMNIYTGDWRPINFQIHPFNFPSPLEIIIEECSESNNAYKDKSLLLWRLEDLYL